MKANRKRSMLAWILTFGMVVSAFTSGIHTEVTEASDSNKPVVQQLDIAGYRTEKVDGYYSKVPTLDGYTFAGWFTDEACTTGLSSSKTEGTYYAKFVSENILGLKAQISANLTDSVTTNDTTGSIRFITSVDSLKYGEVGFEITKGETTKRTGTSNVYKTLYAVGASDGATVKYKPQDVFCGQSVYFKAWTFTDIPSTDYGVNITVKTYWITLDGSIVYGAWAVKSIDTGLWTTALRKSDSLQFSSCEALLDSLDSKYSNGYNLEDEKYYSASLQGGYSNGTDFYQAFISTPGTYSQEEDAVVYDEAQNKATIRKYDLTTGGQVGGREYLPADMTSWQCPSLNHANDITYNSKLNQLIICHAKPNHKMISFFDGTTLVAQKELEYEIFSIDYHAPTDRYVVGIKDSQTFYILDSNFERVGTLVGASNYNSNVPIKHYATQGMACDDNFIYFVRYGKKCESTNCDCGGLTFGNVITVYNWDGEFVTLIDINNLIPQATYEPESISIIGNKVHIGVAHNGTAANRKWSVFELSNLVSQ